MPNTSVPDCEIVIDFFPDKILPYRVETDSKTHYLADTDEVITVVTKAIRQMAAINVQKTICAN